jgi:choice-of-anchor C domain-containing protein
MNCSPNRHTSNHGQKGTMKKIVRSLLVLVCSLVVGFTSLCAEALEPSILVNGSFEEPPGISQYVVFFSGPSIPGWTVESGTVEITGPYWQAAAGSQSLDINGIFEEIGTIYQDIPTAPGQSYLVRFAYAGNPDGELPVIKSANVSWNDNLLASLTFDITGHTRGNMGWTYAQYLVTASGTSSRLRFQSTSPTFCGLTLDDVSVTAIPEPFSATLLSLGLVGFLLWNSPRARA